MNPIINRLFKLKDLSGMSGTKLSKELGISNAAFSDWSSGKSSIPSLSVLMRFSEYFDVSLDWLVYGTEKTTEVGIVLSDEEQRIIDTYRSLSEISKTRLNSYIDGLADASSVITIEESKAN